MGSRINTDIITLPTHLVYGFLILQHNRRHLSKRENPADWSLLEQGRFTKISLHILQVRSLLTAFNVGPC